MIEDPGRYVRGGGDDGIIFFAAIVVVVASFWFSPDRPSEARNYAPPAAQDCSPQGGRHD